MPRIIIIAGHFLHDAVVSTLTRVYLLLLLLVMMGGGFVAELALIEQDAFRLGLSAALVRLLAVAVVVVQGSASFSEESSNGQVELTLALDLSRGQYLLGRALGSGGYAVVLVLLALLAVGWWSPWEQLVLWAIGLFMELLVMALFTLFVVVTFSSLATGIILSMAFYLLSRSIEAFVLMTTSVAAGGVGAGLVWISWLIPNFNRYNQSSWLIYADGSPAQLLPIIGEALLVCLLLLLAALVDFHRREI